MRSGPQRSPKGPPQADTRRRGDLPPLRVLQGEETSATAGDQNRESLVLEGVGRVGGIRPVGAALSSGHQEATTPPPLSANIDPELLADVIGTLFPRRRDVIIDDNNDDDDARRTSSSRSNENAEWSDELSVTEGELLAATKRMVSRGDVAPGPDGVPGRVWAESINTFAPRLRYLFTRCLRKGVYLRAWRTVRLVLIRKEGRPPDSPSVYRPVCLLDVVGKPLERIIAARLEAHVSERVLG
jgi:hypothetical protein